RVLRDEVIPSMREHFEKSLVEYSQGRGALRDIIDSQQTLFRQQTAVLTTAKELARSDLASVRIAAGLFQPEINPMIPNVSTSLSGGMGDNMTGGMNQMEAKPGSMTNPASPFDDK